MKVSELFLQEDATQNYQGGDIRMMSGTKSFLATPAPDKIRGVFSVEATKLTSFEGGPSEVTGKFYCTDNKELTSLEGCPSKVGEFHCVWNDALTDLRGAPTELTDGLILVTKNNALTSLEGCPKEIFKNFHCNDNPSLTSLQGIHKIFKGGYIDGWINLSGCPIKSHILGLLLIKKLNAVVINQFSSDEFKAAVKIINKHLQGDRDVIDCQQEMIEAGLKQYAQL